MGFSIFNLRAGCTLAEGYSFSVTELVVAVSVVVVLEEHTGLTTFSLYPVIEFIWNRNKRSNPDNL